MPRTVRKDHDLKPGKPAKSTNLSDRAAFAWDRLVDQLESAHIQLSTAHSPLLTLAATLSADIAEAWEVVKKEGSYITNRKTGAVQEHPASKKLDALRRDYIKVRVTLGTRAVAAPPPHEGPTLEDLLNDECPKTTPDEQYEKAFGVKPPWGEGRS
jgi:phage terminase small subunit